MIEIDTPVTRWLRGRGIAYEIRVHSRPAYTVEEAAKERGVPVDEMVKSMVLLPKKGPRLVVVCIPGDKRLSLRKVKAVTGIKDFHSSSNDAVAAAVGYPVGAIPPFALPEDALVLADSSILRKRQVNVSTGDPGAGLVLSAWDFRKVFSGRFAEVIE